MELLIVSGQSGGGKSRVADILEDLNYYRVDNMPAALLPRFAELSLAAGGRYERVALVIDARERSGFGALFRALDELKGLDCDSRILYVEADTPAIIKRYKESRRPHPLAAAGGSLEDAVKRELILLKPVRARADYIVNTTGLTLSQLRKRIHGLFTDGKLAGHLTVKIVAFGFKYGLPMDADLVFDVRFLPNPYYVAELRELSGLDGQVADFVLRSDAAGGLLERLESLLQYLLPHYAEEGKRELTVAVGCTGGRHRSVAVAAQLSEFILKKGYDARLITRDIDKDKSIDADRD